MHSATLVLTFPVEEDVLDRVREDFDDEEDAQTQKVIFSGRKLCAFAWGFAKFTPLWYLTRFIR